MMGARREHGFTLIELLVSMALAVVVFGATLSALNIFQTNNNFDLLRNETQDSARSAIDRLSRDLRNVAAPKSVKELPGALEVAKPESITFQTIDSVPLPAESKNATNAMRVRYCLDDSSPTNEVLRRQEMRWVSATTPPIPAENGCKAVEAGWDRSSQLVNYLTNRVGGQNRPVFAYGPSGWSEVSQVVTVEPTLYIDVNPGKVRPGETQLTSAISLRNANRQPIAAFTAESLHKHVLLNASQSEDPDGLALTYTWSEGTTEGEIVLPSNALTYETPEMAEGTTHTFWLKVKDPGGLEASTKQKVTIKL
jgi:prepilin-type N-terminal cleavage/methylation domain-containing protein